MKDTDAGSLAYSPALLRIQREAPSPLPRLVLGLLLALVLSVILWASFSRIDIVAVAPGRLVPSTYVKVVQPADGGIIKEILVREGDSVEAGQVLVRMDPTVSSAEGRQISGDLHLARLELRRVDAELSGTELRPLASDPSGVANQVLSKFRTNRQAHEDAIQAERALIARAEQDLQSALSQQSKLRQTLPIYRDQEQSWSQLVKEGFAGRLLAEERKRQRIEAEQELEGQAHAIEGLRASVRQSEKRLAQIQSNYRQQLANEKVEYSAKLNRLLQDTEKQTHRHGLLELTAPQAGIIQELATHTVGAVLSPGTVLMSLVPTDETLQAEVWVDNEDAGFVRPDLPVRIKVAAYPFQKYGMLNARVRQVSADASDAQAGASARKGEPQSYRYRALVALDRQSLMAERVAYHLSPGMQVSAEIDLGDRTVMEYLLSPVRKVAHEAGRER